MARSFWDPIEGLPRHVRPLVVQRDRRRRLGGLGGGSLIYANVMIRKDEHWFVQEDLARPGRLRVLAGQPRGPRSALRHRRADARAARSSRSSSSRTRWTPKTQAMKSVAALIGGGGLDVAIAQAGRLLRGRHAGPEHADHRGVDLTARRASPCCRLFGECDIGCNYGAKNSLDYNYLTARPAGGRRDPGAPRRQGVRAHRRGGYEVRYRDHTEYGRARTQTRFAERELRCRCSSCQLGAWAPPT